jgi:hypothetical protein
VFRRADRRKLIRGSVHDSDSRSLISVVCGQFFVMLGSYFAIDRLCTGYESGLESKCFTLRSTMFLQAIVTSTPILNLLADKALSVGVRGTFVESSTQWSLFTLSKHRITSGNPSSSVFTNQATWKTFAAEAPLSRGRHSNYGKPANFYEPFPWPASTLRVPFSGALAVRG